MTVAFGMNAVLVCVSLAVMSLPVLGRLSRESVRGKFLWSICLSFSLPAVSFVGLRFVLEKA